MGATNSVSTPSRDGSVDGSMWWWLLLVALATAKRAPTPATTQEPVIEEVTAKQLERVLAEKDYVAVFWCKYPPKVTTLHIFVVVVVNCCFFFFERGLLVVVSVECRLARPGIGCHIPIWRACIVSCQCLCWTNAGRCDISDARVSAYLPHTVCVMQHKLRIVPITFWNIFHFFRSKLIN